MKKLIDYPDSIHKELNIISAKAGKSLTEFIKDMLISTVRKEKIKEFNRQTKNGG